MSHAKTKKTKFLWDMVQKSYDIEYEPEDCEILYLEQLMSRERNPELKEALQDWYELSVRYIAGCYFIGKQRAEGLDCEYVDLCVTEDVCQRVLALPMHPYMTEQEVEEAAESITEYIR